MRSKSLRVFPELWPHENMSHEHHLTGSANHISWEYSDNWHMTVSEIVPAMISFSTAAAWSLSEIWIFYCQLYSLDLWMVMNNVSNMFAEQTDLGSEMIVTDMTLHLLVTLINISYILINSCVALGPGLHSNNNISLCKGIISILWSYVEMVEIKNVINLNLQSTATTNFLLVLYIFINLKACAITCNIF